MNPNLSKRITMSSIRVWPDLANMPGVDAAPTPQAPNEEEEELDEPQMSACFAEADEASEGSPAEATGSADNTPAEAGTEAMEAAAEAAEAAEIPAGGEAGVEGEKEEQVPPSVGTTSSEDVRQGSSSEVPLGQPQPASEETPEEQATEAPEAEGVDEAPTTAMEVEADKEEEVGMEVEAEKDEEEWVNIPGAPQELTPAMPSDAEEEPEESIDDTLQLMLEISEQEPGTKQHVFADSAEKPPVEEELPQEPEPKAEAPTQPRLEALEAEPQSPAAPPTAQAASTETAMERHEVRSPAGTPERKESPAPTVKPKSPGQSGAKRGRNEANPFYPSLRPCPVESSPSLVPRPPKRVKLPAVVMPHGKTQAPGTLLLRAVALVLEELFRQSQPSLVRQVPKIMERNRFTEIALLHQALEKYVAPLPLLPEGDGSLSQIDLLEVILQKLPNGLGVPSGLLRGRTPVLPEVAEDAVKDFLQRLYALINSAHNQEASPVPLPPAPRDPRASHKAPVGTVDSQESEDREAGERRLSNRILHGDTLLSREQVERRIAWKRHYAMLEKMAQAAFPESAEASAAPAPAVPAAPALPAVPAAARAARSSWGLQKQQIEMFE